MSVSRGDLESEVARFLGWSRTVPGSGDGHDDIDAIVDRGLRQFYYPGVLPGETTVHEWSFLKPVATISTNASVSSSTITVSSGVVTLASGTWPAWAAEGTLSVANEDYEVSTRDSTTQLTLIDTSVDISAGTTYELRHDQLALPSNFAGITGPLTYSRDAQEMEIQVVSESYIRALRQDRPQIEDAPLYAAVRPITGSTYGNSYELLLWPTPDKTYRIQYAYNVEVSAGSTIYGGIPHNETIMASCLAIAETYAPEQSNRHRDIYKDRLAASVMFDRKANATEYFGYNSDNSDEPILIRRNLRYATYTNRGGTVYPTT